MTALLQGLYAAVEGRLDHAAWVVEHARRCFHAAPAAAAAVRAGEPRSLVRCSCQLIVGPVGVRGEFLNLAALLVLKNDVGNETPSPQQRVRADQEMRSENAPPPPPPLVAKATKSTDGVVIDRDAARIAYALLMVRLRQRFDVFLKTT